MPVSASTLPAALSAQPSARRDEHPVARRLRFVRQYASWQRAVRELWRFKWREHRGHPIVGAYHTRERAIPYFIRHGTRDVGIFSEVFIAGEYDPPTAVAERLAGLGRPPRVLDLGANIGLFSAFCRERWPGARVVSVEPDPQNLALLQRTAAGTDEIEVIAACAAERDGSVHFVAGQFAESHVADSACAEDTIEVPCVDALRLAADADLVKIDIEGSEWEILADPRLASIGAQALVMEWHEERCPHSDHPAAAHAALRDAGFQVVSEHRPVPSNGTVWALRLP